MGVIKRFAIWSMVLGTLAIAAGASALAFDGTSSHATSDATTAPAVAEPAAEAPAGTDTVAPAAVTLDLPPIVSDVPSDAQVAAAEALARWTAPHTFPAE